MKKHVALSLVICIFAVGCLRTRSQVRDGSSESPPEAEVYQAAPPAAPAPGRNPGVQYDVDEIKQEMTRIEGRLEDIERAQKQQSEDRAKQANDGDTVRKLETKIDKLEQDLGNLQADLKKQSSSPAEVQHLLEKAKSQYAAGDFDDAIESLSDYLGMPSAKKVEEATFLRAEAYYKLKEYKKAIVDYSKFPEKFNRSTRMPAALYKIGLSFEALGLKDDARGFYQELNDKYPKSPEAKKIKGKLRS